MIGKRAFLICLAVLAAWPMFLCAQESSSNEKTTVLIVPYHRFEFHMEYPINHLATANDVEVSEVYAAYLEALLTTWSDHEDSAYAFVAIKNIDLQEVWARVRYGFDSKDRYYGSDLSDLDSSECANILEYYQADLMLFVNWYHVKSAAMQRVLVNGKSENYPTSFHTLDFDVYTVDKTKVAFGKNLGFVVDLHSFNYDTRGLTTRDLVPYYHELADDILYRIANFDEFKKTEKERKRKKDKKN